MSTSNKQQLLDFFAGMACAGDWASQSGHNGEWFNDTSDKDFLKRSKLYYRAAMNMILAREEYIKGVR